MPGPLSTPKGGKTATNRVRGTLDRWLRNRQARSSDNMKRASGR